MQQCMLFRIVLSLAAAWLPMTQSFVAPTACQNQAAKILKWQQQQRQRRGHVSTIHHKQSPFTILYESSSASEASSSSSWTAGDLENDLILLQQAIAKSQAETRASRVIRRECLHYMAQQRRPVSHWGQTTLALTTGLTWIFWRIKSAAAATNNCNGLAASRMATRLGLGFALHFWIVLVWLPFFLLWSLPKRRAVNDDIAPMTTTPDASSIPKNNDLATFPRPRGSTITSPSTYSDPFDFSSNQIARHLVEHWMACITGVLLFYPFLHQSSPLRTMSRLVVRLAVPASLRLYEKMWFLLRSPGQPRPLSWSTWIVQGATKLLVTPWAVSWELACLLNQSAIYPGLGVDGLFLLAMAGSLSLRWLPKPPSGEFQPKSIPIKRILGTSLLVSTVWRIWTSRQAIRSLSTIFEAGGPLKWIVRVMPPRATLARVVPLLNMGLCCAVPLLYLLARLGQCRILYTHNLSLAAESENDERRTPPTAEALQSSTTWRYRFEWINPPQPVSNLVELFRDRVSYFLFLSGSVEEKFRFDAATRYKGLARARGLHILDRLKRDIDRNPEAFALDRSQWKERAMGNMVDIHEKAKVVGRYEDPLGMALQLQFGIGLGLTFDQNMDVQEEGTEPTPRRLQARAVKSALKRVLEIRNPTAARQILKGISDPLEREKKKKEIRDQGEAEIRRIAERLADLIPLEMELESPLVGRYTMPSYSKTGPSEYAGVVDEHSPSLEKFLELAKIKMEGKSPRPFPKRKASTSQAAKPKNISSTQDRIDENISDASSTVTREEAAVTEPPFSEKQPKHKKITRDEEDKEPSDSPSAGGAAVRKPDNYSSKTEEENEDTLSYDVVDMRHGYQPQLEQPRLQFPKVDEEIETSATMETENDDAFIKAWEKQRFKIPGSPNDENDEEDDDDDVVLC